eukprot:TRINITY_DN5678_c0_g1_i1.p1 TRINITY_DN5678_c0_g1~~TRINITY_DN5678_c0_g1_i1.p1  ORF type:complete len:495 (+),score=100.39 TRINITY_DN5678_c0_g1_i1:45-1529(+)
MAEGEHRPGPGRPKKKKNIEEHNDEDKAKGPKPVKYHCDYCRKDITNNIRVKCAICTDFDLCVECFYVGAESFPHKSYHDYQIVDQLNFPLFSEEWGADEELSLLEAIEIYGLGNWTDIADHVGTKTKEQCAEHYFSVYINTATCPLPDMTKVLSGKRIIKLPTTDAEKSDQKPALTTPVVYPSESTLTGESRRFPARAVLLSDLPTYLSSYQLATPAGGAIATPAAGYMPLRGEFETEYHNDAECNLAEMTFSPDDTEEFKKIKLQMLEIYYNKLMERYQRRKFVLENELLDFKKMQQTERKRTKEEKELYNSLKVFLQLIGKEEFDSFINGILEERALKKKIEELKELRQNGIRTIFEAEIYKSEKKRRLEQEEMNKRKKENLLSSPEKFAKPKWINKEDEMVSPSLPDKDCSDVLSSSEKELCKNLQITHQQYIMIKTLFISEYTRTGLLKKATAKNLVKLDMIKANQLFDFFESSGWINKAETLSFTLAT